MSSKVRSMQKARERIQAREGMILTTLGQLLGSFQSLQILLNQDIPIRQSFTIGKIAKAISGEIEGYQSARKTLCEKHANKDADGKAVMLDEGARYDIPDMEAFNKEHAELIETEVSIPGQQIKASELGDVKIAPAHLMALDWLFDQA